MQFDCTIDDTLLRCTLTTDRDLTAPVLCFSGMASMEVVDGGTLTHSLGSYCEMQLPDLVAGQPHHFSLAYPGFRPVNRAWMPLGPYLRAGDQIIPLPQLPAGVRPRPRADTPAFDGLRLVPQPTRWQPTGATLQALSFASDHPACAAVHDLAARCGDAPFCTADGTPVTHQQAEMPDDAYQITIAPDGITVRAGSYGGHFYAGITLLTLRKTYDTALPCGTIDDAPRFGWRGQHLDCVRHFFAPDTITQLLDIMALMKLNRFHWHFADDEAFRLEVDCYPEIWQKTRLRGEGQLLPALFAGAPVSGGSYSKDTARALIDHGLRLNIEILPEIEVPGHALAMAAVFPDTRDPGDNGPERSVQGYARNALNPAMPRTWQVVEALAAEVGALFPFNHLHLGCDELAKDTWMSSPAARTLMDREALHDTDDLQGWMMARIAATVVQNGQRPAAWEEAAKGSNGGIGNNAILFSWTGQGPGVAAARAGYDVVMTPGQNLYLDMAHTDDPDDWGAAWAAFISLQDTIAWDPVPADAPDIADRVIGVQGTFWGEFTTQDAQLWPMLLPRIMGVAVKGWQHNDITGDDLTRLSGHYHTVWPAMTTT